MKLAFFAHNNTGGVGVSMVNETKRKEQKEKRNEAFAAGFWAGLTVIGGLALVLLLIFWL